MHSGHTIPYRRDIQGLRGVAIALVMLAHAGIPGFAGGFVGVDVFFVLSGYLITGLLVREKLLTGKIRYNRFLARRLRRLLPAMLAMLITVLVLATLLLSAYETRMQSGSFVYAATWTSNFFFAISEFDYFAALQAKDLFLHTWSLGIEEQYYIVWPWLVALSFAFLRSGSSVSKRKKPLLYLLAIVFTLSLGLCLHWAEYGPLLSFYMMPARGWQFAMGAAVFIWFQNFGASKAKKESRPASTLSNALIGAAGILLIIGSATLLNSELVYPGLYALVPSVGTALVILAGREANSTVLNRALESRPLVWVGDRSYSLYLWHWPVLLLGDAFGLTRNIAGIVSLVATSILLSHFSYRLIERPFWKGRFSSAAPFRTFVASVAVVALAVAVSHGLKINVFGEPQVIAKQGDYNPRRDVPAIYDPQLGCDSYYHSAELVPCFEGDVNAKHNAVLLGDSIGAQWVSLLTEAYSSPNWRVAVLTKSACPIVNEDYYYAAIGDYYHVCAAWRDSAIAYLAETRPDIVFIGSSSQYAFTAKQWTDGVTGVLEQLTAAATQVVVIPGTPELSFDGPSCLESPYRYSFRLLDSRRECEERLVSTTSEEVSSYLAQAAARFENAHILDFNDLVCPGRRCAAQSTDGLTVFRDRRHLTETFVKAQVTEALSRLRRIRVGPNFPQKAAVLAAND